MPETHKHEPVLRPIRVEGMTHTDSLCAGDEEGEEPADRIRSPHFLPYTCSLQTAPQPGQGPAWLRRLDLPGSAATQWQATHLVPPPPALALQGFRSL